VGSIAGGLLLFPVQPMIPASIVVHNGGGVCASRDLARAG
jgi:hypothetical protein